ncbi:DNA -binding domain-containing protein [Sphingomonas sp. PB4P5]|uniref:DNA -binding domain-containing protein n=1 Tax=Parasphingomonas puruogangriensis TaxID=3096155 RepID=UPI002FC8CE53
MHNTASVAKHDRADFAQEFLRRNANYRAAWAAFIDVQETPKPTQKTHAEAHYWGLVRLFDPDRPVQSAPAIWRADSASQIVSLTPVPANFPDAAPLPHAISSADFVIDGACHLVLDVAGVRHRLQVSATAKRAPLAILLPPLGDPLRAAACDAARRMFAHLSPAEPALLMQPRVLQRQRLSLLLRVLDASLAGASNRDIGVGIVYPWRKGTEALAWKASSERRRVQRLIAEAHALAATGYRQLLKL